MLVMHFSEGRLGSTNLESKGDTDCGGSRNKQKMQTTQDCLSSVEEVPSPIDLDKGRLLLT